MRLWQLLPSSWMLLLVPVEKGAATPTLPLILYLLFFFCHLGEHLTWQRTAEYLGSHADVAAAEPRARVDSDVSGDHWSWEDVPDWNFLFPVASEDLLRQTQSPRWWNIQPKS